jgi:hypothetical protein
MAGLRADPGSPRLSLEQRVARAEAHCADSLRRCSAALARVEASDWLVTLTRAVLYRRRPVFRGAGDPLPDEAAVRERLRALIDSGALPRARPSRIWAGFCLEPRPCTACGIDLAVGEPEYEISGGVLHQRCLNLWPADGADA